MFTYKDTIKKKNINDTITQTATAQKNTNYLYNFTSHKY